MCDCFYTPLPVLSRRTLLGAFACAATAALFSCKDEPKSPRTQADNTTPPQNPQIASSQPGWQPGSQPAAVTAQPATQQEVLGTPDLGAEVFPDKSGVALVPVKDAPCIVIPRTDWTTSKPNFNQAVPMNGIERITVHHTAWRFETDAWKPTTGTLENVRTFHSGAKATDRHWADIAYHFAVDRAGRVWQARPLAYQGAHCKGHNAHNLGIVLLGNFETQSPSAAQLTALINFTPFLRSLYSIPLDEIHTHGELGSTECPGKSLQSFMNRQRKKWSTPD